MLSDKRTVLKIALVGNPNSGKTTLFNRLTGERQAVGNYSGVTVEKREGRLVKGTVEYNFVDLPGVYSLTTSSKDELVTREYLLQVRPDIVVNVVDASNIERNLFLTLQLKELGIPLVLVLNMCDIAKSRGVECDLKKLSSVLGVPVIEVVGVTGEGLELLTDTIDRIIFEDQSQIDNSFLSYSEKLESSIHSLSLAIDLASVEDKFEKDECLDSPLGADWLVFGRSLDIDNVEVQKDNDFPCAKVSYSAVRERADVLTRRRWLAIKLLEGDKTICQSWQNKSLTNTLVTLSQDLQKSYSASQSSASVPIATIFAAERYAIARRICSETINNQKTNRLLWSDRFDRILTHPFWGLLIFFCSMYFVFWLTFAIGNYPVEWLESLLNCLGDYCNNTIWKDASDSLLRSLFVDGVMGGVGSVLVFFPNVFILFAAIAFLEESGYMARGAFLTDRFLRRFGLTGKSFIPMLVGFGCSIPAVMATRIIENRKSRLCTIFVVPLMSCGARFPIYMLIIPAFFSEKWQAPVLWCVYFAGVLIAAILSSILSSIVFKGDHNPLLIELPAYHAPKIRTVGYRALERGWQYLRKAGTTILLVSLVLWTMSSFPNLPQEQLDSYEQTTSELLLEAQELDFDVNSYAIVDSKEDESDHTLDNELIENKDSKDVSVVSVDNERAEKIAELVRKWELNQNELTESQLKYSIAGRIGQGLEPVTKLAGFDWKIGTALVGALAAKEIFVTQLGIAFKVGSQTEDSQSIRKVMHDCYSPLVGICVIIFCLIGAPCLATLVMVAKETSWHWALAQWTTLTMIGFVLAILVFQVGSSFHWGV